MSVSSLRRFLTCQHSFDPVPIWENISQLPRYYILCRLPFDFVSRFSYNFHFSRIDWANPLSTLTLHLLLWLPFEFCCRLFTTTWVKKKKTSVELSENNELRHEMRRPLRAWSNVIECYAVAAFEQPKRTRAPSGKNTEQISHTRQRAPARP